MECDDDDDETVVIVDFLVLPSFVLPLDVQRHVLQLKKSTDTAAANETLSFVSPNQLQTLGGGTMLL